MSERSEAVEEQPVRDGSAAYSVEAEIAITENVPPGYKRTEAGMLPTDWEASTVGEEFTLQLGKMLDAAKNTGTPKPYIGNRAVQWGRIALEEVATVQMRRSELQRYRIEKGDLLVCEGGEVGRAAIWEAPISECYYQKALHRLRSKRDYNPFLMMSFLDLWASSGGFANFVTQTSIAHLPKDKLEIVPLPVPPPKEQRAIATALSDADALIESLDRLIAKKRAIKQAAMQQLLTGQTRLPGFTGEWETKRLGDVADIRSGGTPSTAMPAFWNGGVPWCTPTDITALRGRKYLSETERTISDAGLHASSAEKIPPESIIMTTRATIGECAINTVPMTTNQGFKNLVPCNGDTEFLYYLMTTKKNQLVQLCGGSTFLEIGKKQLHGFELMLPQSREEQGTIANVLSDMDTEIEALERRRDKARQIKQGMMQQLLTGRVRLVQPNVGHVEIGKEPEATKGHSKQFNEAVVISMLARHFGTEEFPLGRKRYTKLSYLLHRHTDGKVEDYLKKAAGPYNPKTKYGGAEKIALKKGYLKEHKGPRGHSGFIVAENVAEAERYFHNWYGPDTVRWLDHFRFKSNDDLEVLATVDMAAQELRAGGRAVDVSSVKGVFQSDAEWQSKLNRKVFSDENIAQAIAQSESLLRPSGKGMT